MMLTGRMRALRVLVGAIRAESSLVSRLHFRVQPTDIDLNVHLTNSRYPQFMDLGRLDLLIRAGLGRPIMRGELRPMAVEVSTVFKRELPLGARFVLETTATGRDRKAVIFTQRFLVGDVEHAVGAVKVLQVGHKGVVEPGLLEGLIAG